MGSDSWGLGSKHRKMQVQLSRYVERGMQQREQDRGLPDISINHGLLLVGGQIKMGHASESEPHDLGERPSGQGLLFLASARVSPQSRAMGR